MLRRCPTDQPATVAANGASRRARDKPPVTPRSPSRPQAPLGVDPIRLCRAIAHASARQRHHRRRRRLVATASYVLRPTAPALARPSIGTLGVGAGFALGAKLVHPTAAGLDPLRRRLGRLQPHRVRHLRPPPRPRRRVVGNDAGWSQIAHEQLDLLHDPIGTVLAPTRYDPVATGFGAVGLHVDHADHLPEALATAQTTGQPVLVDVRIGRTDFAKTRSPCDRYDSHGSTGRPRAGQQHTQHPESSLAGVSPVRVAGIRAAVPRDLGGHQNRETRGSAPPRSRSPPGPPAPGSRRRRPGPSTVGPADLLRFESNELSPTIRCPSSALTEAAPAHRCALRQEGHAAAQGVAVASRLHRRAGCCLTTYPTRVRARGVMGRTR